MESRNSRRGLRGLIIGGVVALVAGGALVFAHAGGSGHGGMHHGGSGFEEMSEHFRVHVKHVLSEVNATPEQQARVNDILAAAAKDVEALHAQHKGSLGEMHHLLTAPTIDRARIEQLRAQHIAALDAASQRCATALADAAEVLTPEQRAELGKKKRS